MYPYQIVFANNATSLLASSISNIATTATLSSGTGQFFPQITDGQAFTLTFSDSPVGLIREIVLVTAIDGDQITMLRGQEGTSAISWSAGSIVENRPTAEFLNSFDSLNFNYAIAGGSSDAITATLATSFTSIPDGFPICVRALAANTTTTPTFVLTMGDTVQPSYTIVKSDNDPLGVGDIASSGFPIELVFSENYNAWVMLNPQVTISGAAGSNTQIQYNDNGSFGASSNLTFDGSNLGAYNITYLGTLTGGTGVINIGNGQIYMAANSLVGIGTTSPTARLEVRGTILSSNSEGIKCGISFSSGAAIGSFSNHVVQILVNYTEQARFDLNGRLLLGTTVSGSSLLVVNDSSIQVNIPKTPSSSSATGTQGQIAWDSNYMYVCVDANTWKRSALTTW